MKNILSFVFILMCFFSYSQEVDGFAQSNTLGVGSGLDPLNNRFGAVHEGTKILSYEQSVRQYKKIDGSPFLHGRDIVVDFILLDESLVQGVRIKYDIYAKQVLLVTEKEEEFALFDQTICKGFVYYNEKGEKELYLKLQPNEAGFYNILFKDDTTDFLFYKKLEATIVDVDRYVPGQDIKLEKFNHKVEYFVSKNNFSTEVNLKNEEPLTYFPSVYKDQVASLMQELRIKKLRREKDYVQLINGFK